MIWFCLTSTSVYLGVVQRAFEVARKKLQSITVPSSNHQKLFRSELPHLQSRFGEVYSQFLALDASAAGLAEILSSSQLLSPEALVQALALKQNGVRVLPQIVSTLMELCGGSTYSPSDPLNRLWRDSQAIHFHPPTPLWVDKLLGEAGITGNLNFDFILDSTREGHYSAVAP